MGVPIRKTGNYSQIYDLKNRGFVFLNEDNDETFIKKKRIFYNNDYLYLVPEVTKMINKQVWQVICDRIIKN